MQTPPKNNVTTLSTAQKFSDGASLSVACSQKQLPNHKDTDFIETVFRFMGDKRHMVSSFLRMKLDSRRRRVFVNELRECNSFRDEGRCLKKYLGLLKVNDAKALLASLPEMLPDKIEALTFHGESQPGNRLMKFAKAFDLSDREASLCMLFFLLIRTDQGD